jgi:mRNA interferase MazF
VIVCPITSKVRPFPTSVVVPAGLPIADEILVSNIRSLDASVRTIRYVGAIVPPDTAQRVRAKRAALITI